MTNRLNADRGTVPGVTAHVTARVTVDAKADATAGERVDVTVPDQISGARDAKVPAPMAGAGDAEGAVDAVAGVIARIVRD